MTKATRVLTLMTVFLPGFAGYARAQGQTAPETRMFLSVDFGAQPQQRTFETSSSFPLYDETATVTSTQPVHNGPVFGVTAGYRVKPQFGIAVGLAMFTARAAESTVVASIPDLAIYGRPKIVTQTTTDLKHTEQVLHLQAVWFRPVGERLEVVLSAGPSAFYVKQDLTPSVTVQVGTQNVTVVKDNQAHGALGFNGGFEGNYFFNTRLGAGLFVRYVSGTVTLPAVADLKLGGVQAGLGIRARF